MSVFDKQDFNRYRLFSSELEILLRAPFFSQVFVLNILLTQRVEVWENFAHIPDKNVQLWIPSHCVSWQHDTPN